MLATMQFSIFGVSVVQKNIEIKVTEQAKMK
jgi:hypothetical protein